MPELKDLLQTKGQKITWSFQREWYQRKDWLCGCATKNRLYCFPCLLFSTADNVWTNVGFCDLKNLPRSLNKHEKSTTHIQSQIAFKTFGASRIDLAWNEQRRLNISIHNAKVKENREVLKYLINATCFLAKQELAFRGNNESASSYNRGNYSGTSVYVVNSFQKVGLLPKMTRDNGCHKAQDGASVMASDVNGVQAKIKEKEPEATFTHCYGHKLNLVLSHSAKCMPECKSFFKQLRDLRRFSINRPSAPQLLDDVVKRRSPRAAPTRWSSNSRLVQTISSYQSDLRAVFRIISENTDSWDNDTQMTAAGYDLWLDERKIMFHNILDNISIQIKAGIYHFGELTFLGLVECTKFYQMSQHFDDTKLQSLSKYARYFDFVRLKADLIGLYSSQIMRNECKSPGQLLIFLTQNDLMQTVPEATKLLQLVLTIPATTASVERSFSALKRLKT
ncbi:uncharacterized protein LOC116949509 [Petromyzon marinus]|uniref:uncharacterized protein LOC116949509 n=1 Tax=Petromyzon marinus TaxID=7757 RepID=UPI003F6FDC3C